VSRSGTGDCSTLARAPDGPSVERAGAFFPPVLRKLCRADPSIAHANAKEYIVYKGKRTWDAKQRRDHVIYIGQSEVAFGAKIRSL
jgi:hypothetical protein